MNNQQSIWQLETDRKANYKRSKLHSFFSFYLKDYRKIASQIQCFENVLITEITSEFLSNLNEFCLLSIKIILPDRVQIFNDEFGSVIEFSKRDLT